MLLETLDTFVVAILSLYIVINPTGVSSVFLGLTRELERNERRLIALRATFTAMAILTVFALGGTFILSKLRITSSALQIAGGIFIFALAFALARGKEREFFGPPPDSAAVRSPRSVAYTPIAVPLMAGPASITVVMTASAQAASDPFAWAALLLAIVVTCLLCLVSMQNWVRLEEKRGPAFGMVLSRIMGLVLAVIAVQFIIDGMAKVLPRLAGVIEGSGSISP